MRLSWTSPSIAIALATPARISPGPILRHLFTAGEILAMELASLHSIHFYQDLMAECRRHILAGDFDVWSAALLAKWAARGAASADAAAVAASAGRKGAGGGAGNKSGKSAGG